MAANGSRPDAGFGSGPGKAGHAWRFLLVAALSLRSVDAINATVRLRCSILTLIRFLDSFSVPFY